MDYSQQQAMCPKPLSVLKNPVHLLATGCGSGLSHKAPGTVGSIAAVIVHQLTLTHLPIVWQLWIILFAFFVGIFLCGKTAADWRSHDHSAIVWDEWIAQWMVLALISNSLFAVVTGFLLFRLFDVLKPWPVSWIDRHIHGGMGIMLDDVAAGFLAVVVFWTGSAAFAPFF